MSAQHHIVQRQVLELTVPNQELAREYQDRLSRIYRDHIIPMLDRYCSELCGPDEHYQIDSLQIELGALPARHFEEQWIQQVEAGLRRELRRHIQAQSAADAADGGSTKSRSQWELFAFFLRTGSLPWWADISRHQLLEENLAFLLLLPPDTLRPQLIHLLREPNARLRLVNQYSPTQLTSLLAFLMPSFQTAFEHDLPGLIGLLESAATAPANSQKVIWLVLLQTALENTRLTAEIEVFYFAALKHIPAIPGFETLSFTELAEKAAADQRLATWAPLFKKIAAHALQTQNLASVAQRLLRRLEELQTLGGRLARIWIKLRKLAPALPGLYQASLLAALNTAPEPGTPVPVNLLQIYLALQDIQQQNPPSAREKPAIQDVLNELEEVFPEITSQPLQEFANAVHASAKKNNKKAAPPDDYPIANAGLVILWPFLGHFFARLNLLDEKRNFIHPESRLRAAGLLQVLATREPNPPEYLLPLNKILTGLPLEKPFEFGLPLREEEATECETLLEAVIAQAPILREMSPDGLRGTFLLRTGLLGSRDGAWLLRVERQTYDIILDRFPWNWEWVKLPWMDTPLRVEW